MAGRSFVGENSRYGYQGSERDPEYLSGSAYTLTYKKGVLINDYNGVPKKQKNKTEYLEDAAGDLAGVPDITQYSGTYNPSTPSTHNFEYDAKGRLRQFYPSRNFSFDMSRVSEIII